MNETSFGLVIQKNSKKRLRHHESWTSYIQLGKKLEGVGLKEIALACYILGEELAYKQIDPERDEQYNK